MQTTLSGAGRTCLKQHASAKPLAAQSTDGTQDRSRWDEFCRLDLAWPGLACDCLLKSPPDRSKEGLLETELQARIGRCLESRPEKADMPWYESYR